MFEVVSLHGHANEQTLFDAIDSKVFSIVDKTKLTSICLDRAKVMRGRNKGLLEILNKNAVNCLAFHCGIHQQALVSKEIAMNSIMNIAKANS